MKIAILTPTFSEFSGIDRLVQQEAQYLSESGHKVTIFCFKAEMKSQYAEIVELGMPKNQTLERIYRLFFFMDFWKINKTIDKLMDFDELICHQYPMTIIGKVMKRDFFKRYTYHDAGVATPELFSSFIEKTYMKMFRFLTNKTIANADNVISISIFLHDVLKKETGLDSYVQYIPIDTNRFNKNVQKHIIRSLYAIKDAPICLYVGRISPHKGIHLLIKAFNIVLKEIPNAKLMIVGKETFGNYAKELKELAKKVDEKAIIFAGFVPDKDLPYFYADANLYTTATRWEGFDMPICEAYECGVPTVAFDIGAHPEVIKDGELVEDGNVEKFAEAIIRNLRKR